MARRFACGWTRKNLAACLLLPSTLFLLSSTLFLLSSTLALTQTLTLAQSSQPQIFRGTKQLPAPVKATVRAIHSAASSGSMDAMREVLDMNELKPMVAGRHIEDVIAHWKSLSADGNGLEILARMADILETGYVVTKIDRHAELYLWPYFAGIGLKDLTPPQKVQLFRLMPIDKAKSMIKTGKYNGFRLGIGKDGTWHFFTKGL